MSFCFGSLFQWTAQGPYFGSPTLVPPKTSKLLAAIVIKTISMPRIFQVDLFNVISFSLVLYKKPEIRSALQPFTTICIFVPVAGLQGSMGYEFQAVTHTSSDEKKQIKIVFNQGRATDSGGHVCTARGCLAILSSQHKGSVMLGLNYMCKYSATW
jgi:hypothetical protein